MTVAELIQRLQTMPQDAEVGSSDDFGDIEEIEDISPPTQSRSFVQLEIARGAIVDD